MTQKHHNNGNDHAMKHGVHSLTIRQRYSDLRTSEGRQLKAILDGLIDDLGGQRAISHAQRLCLENMRCKLIVLFQISKYVDQQESVITEKGELLPCLGRGFTAYSEGIRRDLEALFKISPVKARNIPSIEELISAGKE
jgi:hypothetical protein